jgi:hypothetical protein
MRWENLLAQVSLEVQNDYVISKRPRERKKETSNAWKKLNSPSKNGI